MKRVFFYGLVFILALSSVAFITGDGFCDPGVPGTLWDNGGFDLVNGYPSYGFGYNMPITSFGPEGDIFVMIADDFVLTATAQLTEIRACVLTNLVASAEIYIYSDDGGKPKLPVTTPIFGAPAGSSVESTTFSENNSRCQNAYGFVGRQFIFNATTTGVTFPTLNAGTYWLAVVGKGGFSQAYLGTSSPVNAGFGAQYGSYMVDPFWTPAPINEFAFDIDGGDTTPPTVSVINPSSDDAVQDIVTLKAEASDSSGIKSVSFFVREPNGGTGTPIGMEDLAATYNSGNSDWEYSFDTTQLLDGNYVVLAKAVDNYDNEGWSTVVPFSIRNWAITKLLPSTTSSKAGRTMPVKFTLTVARNVDPAMPFVYNEDLEIRIYKSTDPGTILQTSHYGSASTDYRIISDAELYITNFKTLKSPATYVVEILRPSNNFMVGSFTFRTVK
jgi:hypothetical protein